MWDTSFSTTKAATHEYTVPGTKTIRLEVRDGAGDTDQETETVSVTSPSCGPSTVTVDGVPSSDPAADYDGGTAIRFVLGTNRVLVDQTLDAPTATLTPHTTEGDRVHKWEVYAVQGGHHSVAYDVQTQCPAPFSGTDEALIEDYVQFTLASKCEGTHDATPLRYAIGFDSLPALSVGGTYNSATVTHLDSVLDFAVVEVDAGTLNTFLLETRDDGNVEYCEAERTYHATFTPNDPQWSSLYGMKHIRADQAWDVSLGSTAKSVCIIDTGVRYTHEDLRGPRWLGGYDFVNDDNDPWDDQGHGTHVAGTAAATTDNNTGVAGVGQVGFYGVKVLSSTGSGTTGWVASGIRWCTDQGADVVSLSLGGPSPSRALEEAVDYAWGQGALLVAAAGNDGPCTQCIGYPAAYSKVMAITCTDSSKAQCGFSNDGFESSLAAPGSNILSTCDIAFSICGEMGSICSDGTKKYCTLSGTSMSTPHVSGAAALVWSEHTSLSNWKLRWILQCTGQPLGAAGWDEQFGDGLLDVDKALDQATAGHCVGNPPCSGNIAVGLAPNAGGARRGPVDATISHPVGAHPLRVWAVSDDGARVEIERVDHDTYRVMVVDANTRSITFHAELLCGTMLSGTWRQTN